MSEPTAPPPPPPPQYTPPPPPANPSGVSPNRGIMIVLAYLGPLALVPLLVEKDDREVQWHAKHGLVLFVCEIILWIALTMVGIMLAFMFHGLGCAFFFLRSAISLGLLILHIMCIVKGINGQRLIIPGISQYADRF
jgi:uncharacterized membrane protein